jgi:hypothetical protein
MATSHEVIPPNRRVARAVAGSLFAAMLAVGCGSHAPAAAAHVGSNVVTGAELTEELKALADNHAFLSRVQAGSVVAGGGLYGFSQQFVATVLTDEIETAAAQNLLAARHVQPLDASIATSVTAATYEQTYGGLTLASFPAAYRQLLVRRTADDLALEAALDHVNVSSAALLHYRSANVGQFSTYCVSVVLRPSRASAAHVAGRIRAGIPIATIARSSSLDPSARSGGDLGCGTAGQFDSAFAQVLAAQPVETASAPVHDPQGWYTIVVRSRTVRTLANAAPDIINALLPDDEAASDAISEYLVAAKVSVDPAYGSFDPKAQPPAVVAPSASQSPSMPSK